MPSSLRMQVVWLLSSTREKILKFFKTMPLLLNFLSIYIWDFPADSDGKVFDYNVGDPGSIPESGRSPGEGNGNPLQYSGLENPMDGGSW